VYDTLFEATWETLQQFGKQGSTNGNDSRFAHLGQQLSLHPHLHCIPGGGVDKEEQWKIVEVMVISISSKGFIESFRAKFCENSKQKSL
jgi:hypothetical protein